MTKNLRRPETPYGVGRIFHSSKTATLCSNADLFAILKGPLQKLHPTPLLPHCTRLTVLSTELYGACTQRRLNGAYARGTCEMWNRER